MTKARIVEVRGKLLQKLMEGLGEIEGLDMPQELLEALGEHTKEKNRRKEVIGTLSDELLEQFARYMEQKEEDVIRLERESEDWNREFNRKTDAVQKAADKRHDALWAQVYIELGLENHKDRHFTLNRKAGIVSEVFTDEDKKDDDGQVFDFRPKVH